MPAYIIFLYICVLIVAEQIESMTMIKHIMTAARGCTVALAVAAVCLVSCKDDEYFDKARYDELIEAAFPVTDVDPAHRWAVDGTDAAARFCFEESFPEPGDYDFNDLVLTVLPSVDGRTVRLRVILDAVGATKQIAAAIRVKGVAQSEVRSCTMQGDFDFDTGKPKSSYMIIDSKSALLPADKKRTDEVVVNLFSDAHWAIGRSLQSDGSVRRWMYNTVKDRESRSDWADVDPVSAEYTLEMASEEAAARFTADNLDVFIIENYNGLYMEVHTFPFKSAEVVYGYLADKTAYDGPYVWALRVPTGFRYPAEGKVIGSNRGGMLSGAYHDPGHSFAEWAMDSGKATDWHRYPTTKMVY